MVDCYNLLNNFKMWTKGIFELVQEIDESNAFMKFGRNEMTNDL